MVHHVTWGKNTVSVFYTPATATATTPLTGTGPTSLFGTPATPSPTLAPAAPASSAGAFSFSSAPVSTPQSPASAFGGDDVDDDSSATTLGGHNDDHSDDNSDDDDDRSVNLLSPSQPAKWNREEDETGLLGLSNNAKANANANSNSTRVASPVKWSTTRTTTTTAATEKRKAPERKGLSMSNKSHKSHRTSRQREETKKTPEPVKCDIRPPLHLTDDFSESHWVSCPNPWGNQAHGDGDFVLMSPDCYRVAYESQGHNPPRFVMSPFESENSQYYRTHKCPQEGYRVLQLTRDTLALRSWGFEFNCHDFGGACLVTEVEPLSPAAAAIDVGLPEIFDSSNTNFLGLKTDDMIICINGKKVGGMTELDLAVELDMCGQEVIVVVATCKSTMKCDRTRRGKTWSDIDSERHVQWCNLGNSPEAGVVQSQKDDELEIYGMNRISDVLQHSNLPDTESITSGSVDNTTIDEDEQVSNAANIVLASSRDNLKVFF